MFLQVISLFFLLFTSLFGICSLVRLLCMQLFDRRYDERAVILLPLRGKEENAEYILRGYLQKPNFQVAVLDLGMEDSTRAAVVRLAEARPGLVLLSKETLDGYLDVLCAKAADAEAQQRETKKAEKE